MVKPHKKVLLAAKETGRDRTGKKIMERWEDWRKWEKRGERRGRKRGERENEERKGREWERFQKSLSKTFSDSKPLHMEIAVYTFVRYPGTYIKAQPRINFKRLTPISSQLWRREQMWACCLLWVRAISTQIWKVKEGQCMAPSSVTHPQTPQILGLYPLLMMIHVVEDSVVSLLEDFPFF